MYKEIYKDYESKKNIGYNYRFKILKNSLSRYILSFPMISEFISYLESPVTHMYDSVKELKNFNNFTVDKYDKNVR